LGKKIRPGLSGRLRVLIFSMERFLLCPFSLIKAEEKANERQTEADIV
jgi:hypothetical protein